MHYNTLLYTTLHHAGLHFVKIILYTALDWLNLKVQKSVAMQGHSAVADSSGRVYHLHTSDAEWSLVHWTFVSLVSYHVNSKRVVSSCLLSPVPCLVL